jgi:transcriptional regulator with XRE-family HTH domain
MLANLKAALAARRVRQVDLAIELKVAPSLISEVVHGRRKLEPHQIARVAELLRADAVWLFQEVRFIPGPHKSSDSQEPSLVLSYRSDQAS